MPRKLRIEYPGAIYHVMNRGDQREDIFKDDQDRKGFLSTLGQAWAEAELKIRRKGDPAKVAMAQRLRQESTMSLKWIAERCRWGAGLTFLISSATESR